MPERSAAHAVTAELPVPREGTGWSPPGQRVGDRAHFGGAAVEPALLAWADQDEGCLVLLDSRQDGQPAIRCVNRTGAQLFGYAPEELVGETLTRLLRSPFAAAPAPGVDELPLVDKRRVVHRALLVQRRDGSPLRMDLTSVPVTSGSSTSWAVRLVQEADAERVADDLRTSHERFRALADRAAGADLAAAAGLRLASVNDRFSEVYGESAERLAGMGWLAQVHPEDRAAVIQAMSLVLEGVAQDLPLRVVRPCGELRSVHARIVPAPSASRDAGFVGTLEDVTDRLASEASLAYQASHDPLTGLLNRRRLLEILSEELYGASGGRSGERPALLFLDLDDFKQVNDSLGHHAGDALLLEVARRLREAVRDCDVVSRFGGDEFAVLCRGVGEEAAATEVARRILEAVTGPVVLGSSTISVSGSIGVVVAGPTHAEAEDVLRDADVAMYQAKAAGKDCWALFDEEARQQAQQRVDLARDLKLAVEQEELSVHYQPVVRLSSGVDGRVVLAGVEALVRWDHREHGAQSPSDFVALAEETGLVPLLGRQVLREAASQMVRWQASLGPLAPPSVSVNVSAIQLRQPDFAQTVAAVLAETGLAGSALCLEITETVVMHDTAAVEACFWQLHELGVKISLDDFGTGYSSLSVLRRLPFDQLKIDRSLLPDLSAHTYDPVVAAVVGLGVAMDLAVVAEGVETLAQVAELRRLGCPLAQGFLFGRPMAPEELELWARSHSGADEMGQG